MNSDFEKLASHKQYKTILLDFLTLKLRKAVNQKQVEQIVNDLEVGKLTSADALDKLRGDGNESKIDKAQQSTWDAARGKARIREMRAFDGLINKDNIGTYLDLGCGNGAITAAIGTELFGLKKEHIIGTDINTWAGHMHAQEVSDKITFLPMRTSSDIPIEANTIDVLTAFMMLHHVKDDDLSKLIQEIYRVTTDDAIIILREHDSPNHMVDSLINIEHGLFEVAIEKLTTGAQFQQNYYGKYKSKRDWVMVFNQFGFDAVGQSIDLKTPTRPFFQIFKKNGKKSIDIKTIPELRTMARQLGIKLKHNFDTDGIKRAIISGRR